MTVGELKEILDGVDDTAELIVDADDQFEQNLPVVDAWKYGDKFCISCVEEEEEEPKGTFNEDEEYDVMKEEEE